MPASTTCRKDWRTPSCDRLTAATNVARMFLKSLTIKGFKSFADATTLTLEPGVTVAVGA